MNLNISGHHLEVTDPLKAYLQNKLNRIKKHFDHIIEVDVIFEVENKDQVAKATLFISGETINASEKSDDMYKSIDLLADKLDRLVLKHKEKMKEKR